MVAKIVGIRDVDFKAPDGKQIKGLKVFILYKNTNPNDTSVMGELTDSIFISANSELSKMRFDIGKEYDFIYQSYGFNGKSSLCDIKNKDGSACNKAVAGF